jgi:hypothetical protein
MRSQHAVHRPFGGAWILHHPCDVTETVPRWWPIVVGLSALLALLVSFPTAG